MNKYPFPHSGPFYIVSDDRMEVAYYSRDCQKYKRVRMVASQTWLDVTEQHVDNDIFWMIVACVERGKRYA